jgi:protein TonB
MNAPTTLLCCLFAIAAARSVVAAAPDAEGCQDLKQVRRIQGCVIVECASKQRDTLTVELGANDTRSLDASINSVTYSCPSSVTPPQVVREVGAKLRESSYQILYEDKEDPTSVGLTARKDGQWIKLDADRSDSATMYSLAVADTSLKKPAKAESCIGPQAPSFEKSCVVVECSSALFDTVEMRAGLKGETSLRGSRLTTTLICDESKPTRVFDSAQKELRDAGFEIVFDDRTHADNAWLTGRLGKRWVELSNSQEGDSMQYVLTVVPSAEIVAGSKPSAIDAAEDARLALEERVKPAPEATPIAPIPPPVPHPEAPKQPALVARPPAEPPKETAAAPASPAPAPSTPARASATPPPAVPSIPTPAAAPKPVSPSPEPLIPPKPLVEVPLEVSDNLKRSIFGTLFITINVEVNEKGEVTKAALTGKITKDMKKLETAALDAVRRWKFEPAHQGDRLVPGQVAVKIHFEGEILRTNIPLVR